jgi:hypothetical protein
MQAEPDREIDVRGAVQLDHFRADLVKRPLASISTLTTILAEKASV